MLCSKRTWPALAAEITGPGAIVAVDIWVGVTGIGVSVGGNGVLVGGAIVIVGVTVIGIAVYVCVGDAVNIEVGLSKDSGGVCDSDAARFAALPVSVADVIGPRTAILVDVLVAFMAALRLSAKSI